MPAFTTNASIKLFKTAQESEKPEQAEIQGSLPPWLEGKTFLRVGPAFWDFGDQFTFKHWLDGYALLQKFEFGKDVVKFEKRYLQSDSYKRGIQAQRPVISEFASFAQRDPNKGFFARIVSNLIPEFTDNNYSSLFQVSNDVFASCDTCFFRRIDGKTLDTQEKFDGTKLFGVNGQSAHPLVDEATGDVYNVGFNLLPTSKYTFFKMPQGLESKEMFKRAKTIAVVSSRWSGALAINHSFGMTKNYLIYIEQPVVVTVGRILGSLVKGETLKDMLDWRPHEKNRFIIVEKSNGSVMKTDILSTKAFYFMHIINCYEEDNQIIVDVVSYDSPNMLDSLYMDKLRQNEWNKGDTSRTDLSCIQRFVIPVITDIKLVEEGVNLIKNKPYCKAIRNGNKIVLEEYNVTERGIEMPMINKTYLGKPYRFIYAAGTFNKSSFSHTITKTDLQTGKTEAWKGGEHCYPGEPYFISKPNATDEDDGIIIAAITDERDGAEDYFLILDAKTMKEIGRASFKTHIPSALHGMLI